MGKIVDGNATCFMVGSKQHAVVRVGNGRVYTRTEFTCRSCRRRWSVEDMPDDPGWHCPWCGIRQSVDPNELLDQTHHKSLSIVTAQGLGDIHWVIQKLSPFTDELNIDIAVSGVGEVVHRSLPWLKLYKKVKNVSTRPYHQLNYLRLVYGRWHIEDVLKGKTQEYCVNGPLEEGTRLEEIEPGYPIDWAPEMNLPDFQPPFEKYTCLYASGMFDLWKAADYQWVAESFGLPIVVIGANWDRSIMDQFRADKVYCHEDPGVVAQIIRHATAFVGHQSGLSILADTFNVPTNVMLYLPTLPKLMHAWHRNAGYRPFSLDRTPEQVVSNLIEQGVYGAVSA